MIFVTMTAAFDLPPPFDMLPPDCLQRLTIDAGDLLFRQGDASRALFIVASGAISLVRHTRAGRKVVLFRAFPGDTLAEPALFSDTYHCDAVVERPASIVSVQRKAVLRHIETDGTFSTALVRRLALQVQSYRRRLELLAIRPAKDRVLAALADGWLTGSVMEFATDLGLAHEVVYRALADLCSEGQVERLGRGRYRAASNQDESFVNFVRNGLNPP